METMRVSAKSATQTSSARPADRRPASAPPTATTAGSPGSTPRRAARPRGATAPSWLLALPELERHGRSLQLPLLAHPVLQEARVVGRDGAGMVHEQVE